MGVQVTSNLVKMKFEIDAKHAAWLILLIHDDDVLLEDVGNWKFLSR